MVPLTADYLVADWLAAMPEAEVWLVVGCRLGSINHALLTLAQLAAMGRPARHIILNAPLAADESRLETTRRVLLPFLASDSHIHTLPHGQCFDWLPD